METQTLFKTRYGSHLYGTATQNSDQDWKSVVLPPINILLRGTSVRNTDKSTSDENTRNTSEDVDEGFIPLQVFANAFFEGQTYALELAYALVSKNENVCVYDDRIVTFTQELIENYLTKNVNSMVGFAFSQAHKYGIKGKRLESIDTLYYLVKTHLSLHGDKATLGSLSYDIDSNATKYLYNSEYNVGGHNPGMKPCVKLVDKVFPHDIKLGEAMLRITALQKQYGSRSKEAKDYDGHDWRSISHAVRVAGYAISLLKEGKLTFPADEVERNLLVNIKKGLMPWDNVEEVINQRLQLIDDLLPTSTLPEKTPEMEEQFTSFLDGWLLEFYNFGN